MDATPKYVLFLNSLLAQIPPGEESFIALARLMAEFHERVLWISMSPFHGARRRELLDAAGEELMKAVIFLVDTEADEPTKLDTSS